MQIDMSLASVFPNVHSPPSGNLAKGLESGNKNVMFSSCSYLQEKENIYISYGLLIKW